MEHSASRSLLGMLFRKVVDCGELSGGEFEAFVGDNAPFKVTGLLDSPIQRPHSIWLAAAAPGAFVCTEQSQPASIELTLKTKQNTE